MLCLGNLDLIFSNTKLDNNLLECIPFFDEEIILLTPTSFKPPAIIKKDEHAFPFLNLADVEEPPFVLFKTGHYLRNVTDMIFADFGIQPKVILETDNWQTCLGMVESGMALTLLPYSPLTKKYRSDKVSGYSINSNYYRHLLIYHRKKTYHPKIMEKFINLAQSTINEINK